MADSHTESKRVSYQPLHPSVRWKLEKAYVRYHDTYFQYLKPDTEWNLGWRIAPSRFASTSSKPVKVGSVIDLKLGKFSIEFTPQRRVTGNLPPNLEASAAAFGGTFPSMPRSTLATTCIKDPCLP
jgi:hypothetical protein